MLDVIVSISNHCLSSYFPTLQRVLEFGLLWAFFFQILYFARYQYILAEEIDFFSYILIQMRWFAMVNNK